MIRNLLINLFFLIPIWLLELISIFNKDIKRKFIFDTQSKIFLSLMPKFDIHEVADEEISTIRNLIEEKRKNLNLSKKTKRPVQRNDHLIGKNKSLLIREYIPYQTDNENIILFFHGGGYVLNSVETHDPTVAYFSEKLRTKIYSLDYSLSPEYKFPHALNEGIFPETALNAQDYIDCEGSLSFGFDDGSKQVYQDWKADGHGKVNLSQAMKQSCNVYFWDIALKIWRTFGNTDSEALLQEYSKQLGFSSLSNIDLPFEKEGVVPDRELFEEWTISRPELVRPEGWLGGDLMNLIIGQGAITTTPVQVSNAYRTLLTGEKSAPFISLDSPGRNIENINISEEFIEFLLNDLNLVTNPGGTAYRSFQIMGDQIFDIGGKTGTAQNAGELNNTSWFVGVDSISNPTYIVVTVVEEGGSGSAVAAPISRRIIQHLRESDLTPVEFGEITE